MEALFGSHHLTLKLLGVFLPHDRLLRGSRKALCQRQPIEELSELGEEARVAWRLIYPHL